MVSTKNIVVLGGSYGGVSSAHYILKHILPALPTMSPFKVILISTSSEILCRPACPRAMISDELLPQAKLFVSIPEAFAQYPVQSFSFEQGTAARLDHSNRTISVKSSDGQTEKTIDFFALVIATGASTPSPLLGLNHDSEFLRKEWAAFREALATAKSVVIAGGGPAGVETAGELGEYLNGQAGWFSHKLENPRVHITVVTSGSQILPLLRPSIAQKAENYLARVGVTVIKNTKVTDVAPRDAGTANALTTNATVTLADGKPIKADIYIPATGTTPNTAFVDQSLLEADGRVQTNISTLRVEKAGPRVYAIGDASSYARPAVHNIMSAVPVLCANIRRDLLLDAKVAETSVAVDRIFQEDTRETQLVPIGTSKGVGVAMGYQIPSFLVRLIKGRDYWLWTTGKLWNGNQWAKET
ncbi:hypothetical protein N7474_001729 [Penicillium riverlandense]|uniref:uncharacterized protein n=1 Tax=Penicillium riverlandense TaxID=1903569 RepID=UPI0025496654|nr:uncharacterized protein N7474_001729 [Penicillium riverlandense]KAJ5833418.1 hypothetical protein N7474_001729 [Penicillium riverlandense]